MLKRQMVQISQITLFKLQFDLKNRSNCFEAVKYSPDLNHWFESLNQCHSKIRCTLIKVHQLVHACAKLKSIQRHLFNLTLQISQVIYFKPFFQRDDPIQSPLKLFFESKLCTTHRKQFLES